MQAICHQYVTTARLKKDSTELLNVISFKSQDECSPCEIYRSYPGSGLVVYCNAYGRTALSLRWSLERSHYVAELVV
jgi:hypothetical protein